MGRVGRDKNSRTNLVGPLVEKRRDGVISAVEHEKKRRAISLSEVEQRRLLGNDLPDILGQTFGGFGIVLIPNHGAFFQRQQRARQTLHTPSEHLV